MGAYRPLPSWRASKKARSRHRAFQGKCGPAPTTPAGRRPQRGPLMRGECDWHALRKDIPTSGPTGGAFPPRPRGPQHVRYTMHRNTLVLLGALLALEGCKKSPPTVEARPVVAPSGATSTPVRVPVLAASRDAGV